MTEMNDKTAALGEIEKRIHQLERLSTIRYAALPIVAVGAAAGVLLPVAFPIIAAATAAIVGAEAFFTVSQRKILNREIEEYRTKFDVPASEVTALSSSANTVTVAGSST